jgi:O-acetyl-ADP-ribose deacetylase (regulator of RNase III)
MKIKYVEGNAVSPDVQENEPFIIVHVCNDMGAWGSGFVMALSEKWSQPEREYRSMGNKNRVLGNVQFVVVGKNQFVANLIGQHKTGLDKNGNSPIRYDAIEKGLTSVFKWAETTNSSIHMPRIGCGLAGGKWSEIEKCIENASKTIKTEINVTVYDFVDTKNNNYVKPNLD